MSSRRRFIQDAAHALGAVALNTRGRILAQASDDVTPNTLIGVRLQPFVDPLRVPTVLQANGVPSTPQRHTIRLHEFGQKLHRDLPPTIVWGYEGSSPGPTIIGRRGKTVTIDWLNRLPARHRLSIDHTLDGAGRDLPEVRTVVHLHGGHVSAANDGYPEEWIVPGQTQRTVYPNRQPGATLWYHDHAMGITRLNSMMGLAGFYLITDPEEERLQLPAGRFDVPLALQDRTVDPFGVLAYPVSENPGAPWVPEFFGTHILVNGRVTPYFVVEPRRYRFRLLNASNARTFRLSLFPEQFMLQIGTDGGLLPEPVQTGEVVMMPGERIDLIIDFAGRQGRWINLVNDAPAPYPSGGGLVPGLVMQFRVNRPLNGETDTSRIPDTLASVAPIPESAAAKRRLLKLVEVMPANGQPHRVLLDGKRFMDPVTEDPLNNTTEIWEIANPTLDAHPIHLHAVHFQLLNRRSFDVPGYRRTGNVVPVGNALRPRAEERGWKDTIVCPPGQVTRIIVPFSGEPGRFVWHCHMLEHEDNEMMRPFILRG